MRKHINPRVTTRQQLDELPPRRRIAAIKQIMNAPELLGTYGFENEAALIAYAEQTEQEARA